MTRHSKNATATTHFTYHERSAAGHGTLKRRYGKDSQLPFAYCCLCLASTCEKDPLASPSGFIYCKECIYGNLLAQKRSIQENMEAYERYRERKQQEEDAAMLEKEREQMEQLLKGSKGLGTDQRGDDGNRGKPKDSKAAAEAKMKEKVDRRSDEEKRAAMLKTSYWIPECAPTAEVKMHAPDTKTRDPMSNEEMKLKHLMPVRFEWEKSSSGNHVICAVTKKAITHQKAVLLRPSGQVVLESCLADMVKPTMTCPVTGLKLRKKDIIHLQMGGTGYSAHSEVEAKKYRPTMT